MEKFIAIIGAVVVGFSALLMISFLLSWPVYMLWNGCLVDAVDTINEVTWLQAWGISILFGFLFNSSSTKSSK